MSKKCGAVFGWDIQETPPLQEIIKVAMKCNSDKVFEYTPGSDAFLAVVGAKDIDEALQIVKTEDSFAKKSDLRIWK